MMYVRAYYLRALILLLFLAAVCVLTSLGMRAAVSPYVFSSIDDVPRTEVAIVLGASVSGGKPSPILADRANAAIALYSAGKVTKILVTGDNGTLSYNEVAPVRQYLLDAGVLPGDIFLDHAGFDTYSSMYRTRDVFLARSVTIVTQDFHLPRALWIAQHLGLTAYGVAAEGRTSSPYNYVREIPASLKALFEVWTRREPKYLGPTFPLSGSGEATWD